jgi:1-deoxy-D-xylulose-5-phosphate reductoisomerase
LKAGGSLPTILNAANEIAVRCFLEERIGFLDITWVAAEVLDRTPKSEPNALDEIFHCDESARVLAEEVVGAMI